jgi:putative Mg2+ transporter-C (MgtC) family protein
MELSMEADYEILLRFLIAALWGGLVGVEREYRSKSAGFRTMIMISVGSCFFTMMSAYLGGGTTDRIASNIVTGIGFLGAGVIFRSESRVNGITTAATIWAVAAVGMGIGAGYYFASGVGSIIIILVLAALPYVEDLIERTNRSMTYNITSTFTFDKKETFIEGFVKHKLKPRLVKEAKENDELMLSFDAVGSLKHHESMIKVLQADASIKKIEQY